MEDIKEEYYQLILKDKEYLSNHILNIKVPNADQLSEDEQEAKITEYINTMNKQLEEVFIWRKVESYKDLQDILNSKNVIELLRIEDYYIDELGDLLEQYHKVNMTELEEEQIEQLYSKENLQTILKDDEANRRIKDCIEINAEAEKVCRKLEKYIKEAE